MNDSTISDVPPFNIRDTMAAAANAGRVRFADCAVEGIACIIAQGFKTEGVESIAMNDPRLIARASEVCANALDHLGKDESVFLFAGLGGFDRRDELKRQEPDRYKLIQGVIADRRVLWMRSAESSIDRDTLVLFIAGVCWQVDYDTSPRTVAHRC